jgi:hypothetical protein
MHLSPQTIALWAALLPRVAADFNIYRVEWNGPWKSAVVWQVFDGEPNCDEAFRTPVFADSQDVSGSKMGVRCAGSGCAAFPSPEEIDQLEMHFSNDPLYHWSKCTTCLAGSWKLSRLTMSCSHLQGS